MKKKFILIGILIITIFMIVVILITSKSNLISLNYDEIIQKINNSESFVLCITATDCIHCQDFKPKLEKIANEYDIKIYYTECDLFSEEDYADFRTSFSFDGSTPTTIFFIDGKEETTANRIYGNVSSDKVIDKLKSIGFISD